MIADLFRPLAGPFSEADAWIIDNIAADLRRGGIPHEIRVLPSGEREIWRSVTGWQEVIDIEAEVQEVATP